MIIAMVAVGTVKPAANQIVDMVSVWDSLVAAAWTVAVRTTAGVIVGMMQMAIVKVIDVVSMADGCVSTVRAMLVCGGACHEFISSRSGASKVCPRTI